jgi:hypothetical protein
LYSNLYGTRAVSSPRGSCSFLYFENHLRGYEVEIILCNFLQNMDLFKALWYNRMYFCDWRYMKNEKNENCMHAWSRERNQRGYHGTLQGGDECGKIEFFPQYPRGSSKKN